MCGIVGYVGPKDCSEVLVNALTKLEYRGYDSAGIAVFDNGEIKTVKTKGKLQDLKDKLAEVGTPKGHVGIGHTRWATHGEPSDVNSHPHSGARVTIVHNGIIENYMELKDFLISKGRTFLSDTDTEVVAQLLDYKYNGARALVPCGRRSRVSWRSVPLLGGQDIVPGLSAGCRLRAGGRFRLGCPAAYRKALFGLLVSFLLLQMCWYGINYLPSAQGVSVHTYNLN